MLAECGLMTLNTNETLTKAESSRINGAKSHGPVTDAGKQRSSLNRTTHGMRSSRVVLHTESQNLYDTLNGRFVILFDPKDIFEEECVTNMVNARWRIRRLEAADTANLNLAIEESRPEFEKKFENLTPDHQNALAYRAIAQTAANDIISRYEERQHRIFERSYRLLCKHRGKHGALPARDALREAESGLPAHNLREPDPPPETIEPETPSVRLRATQTASESSDALPLRHPPIAYEEDYKALQPIFDALADRPDLKIAVSEAIIEYRDKHRKAGQDI
jgi:hypothetical protein